MRIIDDRDERTRNRKLKKAQYDELMTLSAKEEKWARLLDEGTITYAGGEAYLYITKGTLRAFYDGLDPDYVGSVNVGHTNIETFPDRIVGVWTKNDLRLVDIGGGREALDVRLRLFEGHPVVKALEALPFELGVSAEFYPHFNEEMTRNEALNPLGIPIIDGVDITDYAIVGDAGNVSSMGVQLKGETMVDIEKLGVLLDEEQKSIEDVNVLLAALEVEEPEAEEASEEAEAEAEAEVEEVSEEAEVEAEEVSEETEESEGTEETEEEASEESEETEAETEESEAEAEETDVNEVVESLLAEVENLRAENESLKAQLASKDAEWQKFATRLKKMAVVKTDTKKPEVKAKVQYTDGIGE